jgi:3-hydroxybutyryl-CoA dehydratase
LNGRLILLPHAKEEDVMLDNLPRGTICIEDIEMGMTRYIRKVVTDEDIEMFAKVSTDHNPVHLDDDYAEHTIFRGRIAHGMLTAGLISAVIGEQLPGHGTIYMGQSLKFLAPVRPGDTVYAEVKVIDIDFTKRRVKLDCHCSVDGKKVLMGEATVLAPSRKLD